MDSATLACLVTGSILVALSLLVQFILTLRRSKLSISPTHGSQSYSDEDGETLDASALLREVWPQRCVILLSWIGLPVSLALPMLALNGAPSATHASCNALLWIQFAAWVLCCLQTIPFLSLKLGPSLFHSSHAAFWTSVGCAVLAAPIPAERAVTDDAALLALCIAIISIAFMRAVSCLLVQRRPNVYFKSRIVDREQTTNLLSRLTFSWVASLLITTGKRQGVMTAEELPQLPFQARSQNLYELLASSKQHGQSLLQAMVTAHWGALLVQTTLALSYAILGFGPQISLFFILESLEGTRDEAGAWVAVLGITMFLASSTASWLWCITYSRLAIPVYSELLAVIYSKALRRKVIQPIRSDDAKDKEEAVETGSGQQDTFNLASIDTKRISECLSYQHLVPSSIAQFVIGCGLLLRFIGWESLLAGLLANLLASPVNFYIAKNFAAFQAGLMQARDHRTAVVNEVLSHLRQIKYSSLESLWESKVANARQKEVDLSARSVYYESGFQATWTLSPLLLSAVSLTTYTLLHGRLEASIAFTSISIFGSLEVALSALPHLFAAWYQARISIDRIDQFLSTPDKATVDEGAQQGFSFQDATISWPVQEGSSDLGFRLSPLTFEIPPKSLTVISGRTGSGKSLLLSAMLGESELLSGTIQSPSRAAKSVQNRASDDPWIVEHAIAYVPQTGWIENGTVRENILFGLPFDQGRYKQTLFASCLERDLDIFEDGDNMEVGANGVNLSGGQRARVVFARALYSRAGVLILDDIFSALDTDTSQHVYDHGVMGALTRGRTRILATHHAGLCFSRADFGIILEGGAVSLAGSMESLKQHSSFSALATSLERGNSKDATSKSEIDEENIALQARKKFSPEEQRESGSVPLRLYARFIGSGSSIWWWFMGIFSAIFFAILILVRSWWLSVWTRDTDAQAANMRVVYDLQQIQRSSTPDLGRYIGVYVALSLLAALMGTLRFFFVRMASLRSSQALFKELLAAVLRAPLRWVDTTPTGRILNRFTSDTYILDFQLGSDAADLLLWTLQIVTILAACVSVSPYILIPAALLLTLSIALAVLYLRAARELKRLESVSRSPILEQLSSTLAGLATIRAFDRASEYAEAMFTQIDSYAKVSWHLWLFNWWLQLRVNLLGALFSTVVATLVVHLEVPASLAGFAISFLLLYSHSVSSMVRFFSNFEMNFNATERVLDFASIETETSEGQDPPASWPSTGKLAVENLSVRYASDLPDVLKGLSFSVESNQRVGVVGRTGSGKSTLALALFRFMEPTEGRILLDGLDVSTLKLQSLRRALAMVPQHPVLFTGTVRSNLDPAEVHSDGEVHNALERVRLISSAERHSVTHQFALSAVVTEGGHNFSQGQRQLLCLARAILQRPKVMILDEATSSVDMTTDGLIQETIRTEFGREMSTLLVIAHRLSTVADFDKILVLDEGRIAAVGTPKELLLEKGGLFGELVKQSGERRHLEDIILGSAA